MNYSFRRWIVKRYSTVADYQPWLRYVKMPLLTSDVVLITFAYSRVIDNCENYSYYAELNV